MPIEKNQLQSKGSIPNPVRSLKQQGARIFSDSSAFPVNIQSGANDIFTLNTLCSVNTTIKQLKDIIINERGLGNGQNFTLKYNGIVMQDNETLGSHNINDFRHLILMVYQVGAATQPQSNNIAVAIRDDNAGSSTPLLNDVEAQYRRNLEQYQSASANPLFFVIQLVITVAMFYTLDIVGLVFSYQYKTDCGNVTIRVPPRDFSASQIMRWNAWAYIIGITITFIVMAINPKLNNLGGLIIWFVMIWSIIFSIAGIAVWNSDDFDVRDCKSTEFGKMLLAFSVIKLSFYGLACCCVCLMSFSIMAGALANQ